MPLKSDTLLIALPQSEMFSLTIKCHNKTIKDEMDFPKGDIYLIFLV